MIGLKDFTKQGQEAPAWASISQNSHQQPRCLRRESRARSPISHPGPRSHWLRYFRSSSNVGVVYLFVSKLSIAGLFIAADSGVSDITSAGVHCSRVLEQALL